MRRACACRRGFTLVEMLVTIFIVGILVALVLSALGRSRAQARTRQCLNNIRQVGLGLTQFEHDKGRFPDIARWDGAAHSWVVDLLPYVGAQAAHNRWDFTKSVAESPNREIADTPLEILTCPSDTSLAPGRGNLTYVVNAGFANFRQLQDSPVTFRGDRPRGPLGDAMDLNGNGVFSSSLEKGAPTDSDLMWRMGVFFVDPVSRVISGRYRSHSSAGIRDGLSTTIMLSENLHAGYAPPVLAAGPPQSNWASPFHEFTSFIGSSYICEGYSCARGAVHYENANNYANTATRTQAINGSRKLPLPLRAPDGSVVPFPFLSSFHPGGVNVVFCDGSARLLSDRISGETFAKLITPNGTTLPVPLRQSPVSDDEY